MTASSQFSEISTSDSTGLRSGPYRHAAEDDFPALQQIIRLTEQAMAARNAETIVARLAAGIAPLIERHRLALPRQFLQPAAEGPRRIELHHDPVLGFQVLALIWAPGQGTAMHDHAGSWGIEAVWCGSLLVAEFAIDERTEQAIRLRPQATSQIGAGQIITLTPLQNVHYCRNTAARDICVSLHVYGTALDQVTEYSPLGDGWYQHVHRWLPLEATSRPLPDCNA